MKALWAVVAAVLLLCFMAGCGGESQKGQNKDKDKPRAGETAS